MGKSSFDDDDPPSLIEAGGHRPVRRRKGLAVAKQGKTSSLTQAEMLDRFVAEIARICSKYPGPIVDGDELPDRGDAKKYRHLIAQRDCMMSALGPYRVESGYTTEFRRNRRSYRFVVYQAWSWEFLLATVPGAFPQLAGSRDGVRDCIVWLLWNFRNKAKISIGQCASRRRQELRCCAECGHKAGHKAWSRRQIRPRACPRCGCRYYTVVDTPVAFKPAPRITKAILRWWFKLSRRHLDKILSQSPRPNAMGPEKSLPA